jgi:short-subunit dehydrogenase
LRKPENESELNEFDSIKLYQLDVTSEKSIQDAITKIIDDFKSVDIVLNNAGYGLVGPFEAVDLDRIKRQFDTNVFGLMEVTRAVLPHFREKKSGLFINVSSVGGFSTYPFTSLYHASKWAVEGFSESLSYELGELGIQIKLVEPGAVKTDFSGRSMDFAMPDDFPDYLPSAQKFMSAMQNSERVPATAEAIAEGIFEAATDGKKQLRYPLGDGQQVFDLRQKVGADAFIEMMKQNFFGNQE